MKWMPFRSPPTAHVAPLTSADRAGELAALHATAFARPWEADEFERMLCERGHVAHALMLGTVIGGFVLSRQVLDEAEILTVVLGPASRGAGLSRQLLRAHLVALEDLACAGSIWRSTTATSRRSPSTAASASPRPAAGRATMPGPTAGAPTRS